MLIPFYISGKNNFMLDFQNKVVHFYYDYGIVTSANGEVYEIQSPYKSSDLEDLKYIQNGDILYLFHPRYPIKTLTRYANDNWMIADMDITGGPWDNVNTSSTYIQASSSTGVVTLTSSAALFKETDIGRLIRLTVVDTDVAYWQASKGYSLNDIVRSDDHYYQAQNSATSGNEKPVHTEGTKTDGAVKWKYLHSGYGTAKISGFTDSKHVSAIVQDYIPNEIVTNNTTYWELGMIHSGNQYPVCGAFFRNRFCFMIMTDNVPKVCLSCSDDYTNFMDKEHGEVLATNAITVSVVNDKYNIPSWLCASDVLFVGTSSGEYYIDSASSAEAIAPDNTKIQIISEIGSKPIQPVRIGSHVFFVSESGTSVRDLIYSFNTDSYDPVDMSIYGKHLFSSGIKGMVYQEYPDKVVWFMVNDGRLIGLTFSSEQQVLGLHQHYLKGNILSIAVLPSYEFNFEDLWVIVERQINNKTVKSIEYINNGYTTEYPEEVNNIRDNNLREIKQSEFMKNNCSYLDGCLSVIRTPNPELEYNADIALNGLDHLEGETVKIIADGAEMPEQIVTNGTITVKNKYSNIKVGLPVVSQFVPQNIYIQTNTGAGVGDVQRIDHVTLMLWRSLGGKMGKDSESLQDIYYRKTDEKMSKSAPLYTGNKEIPIDMGTSTIKEKGATVLIYNDSVFPMNILAIAPHFTTSGNGK